MTRIPLLATVPATTSRTRRRPSAVARAAVGAVLVTVLLTACAGGSDGADKGGTGDEVASVARPSTSDADAKSSPATGGDAEAEAEAEAVAASGKAPQRRLDSTETETLAMFQPYLRCLKDRDVPVTRASRTGKNPGEEFDPSWFWYVSVDMADYPAAEKACNPIRPLMPRELDPKRNPDYLKDFRAQIECMEARGVKVAGLPDGSGYNYRDGYQPTEETGKIENDCQLEAFSDQG